MTQTFIAIVVILSLIQIPLDIRTGTLSRQASATAYFLSLVVIASGSLLTHSIEQGLLRILLATIPVCIYVVLHKTSSGSVGWGDVLLVAPLSLNIAYLGVTELIMWQLLATLTGTFHSITVRLWSRQSSIPFGPHLLLSALVVLILGL